MTSHNKEPVRAMSLLSGGLDSQLAACLLRDQGIDVHGIVFESPFFCADAARAAAADLKLPLHVLDFTEDILRLLDRPKHGFGSCMNPCIDCHAGMLKRAGDFMVSMRFQFLSTGEVLNERPMSQNRRSLDIVAQESGYGDLILRPLSAGLLQETLPERSGWVDRSRLLSLEGRGRRRQIGLAAHYGLAHVPQPAGGCRLTEPNFARRLKELKEHEGLGDPKSLSLLRYGRHFRLADDVKLIVGRDQSDNAALERMGVDWGIVLRPEGIPGPACLVAANAPESLVLLGAAICACYSDVAPGVRVGVRIVSASGERVIETVPADRAEIAPLRV